MFDEFVSDGDGLCAPRAAAPDAARLPIRRSAGADDLLEHLVLEAVHAEHSHPVAVEEE